MKKAKINPESLLGEANKMEFILSSFLGKHAFITLGLVVAVDADKNEVDIKPMIHSTDAEGNMIVKEVIYGVSYFRYQRGNSAAIMNPVIGDIGLIAVCDHDITNVKASKKPSVPATGRKHNYSDAIYFGGVASINQSPTQYVEFADNAINVVSPHLVTVKAPDVTVTADNSVSVKAGSEISLSAPTINIDGALQQGSGENGGEAKFANEVTVKNVRLSVHTHSGVQSGSNSTGQPNAN